MLEVILCFAQLSSYLHLFLLELLVPSDPAPVLLVLSRSPVNTRSTQWWPCEAAITGPGLVLAAPRSSSTRTTLARPISHAYCSSACCPLSASQSTVAWPAT